MIKSTHALNVKLCLLLLAPVLLLIAPVNASAQSDKAETATLEGQFVCSQCWFEADRKTTPYGTAADMECAKECAEQKVPPAIAVKAGDDYKLFLITEGGFKKPGENWLEYIGKQVRVAGRLLRTRDTQFIQLDELTVIADHAGSAQSSAIGTEAELALKDLFGIEQKLSAYRAKIVVLNFWATWCIPCRREMPDLAAIQTEYAAMGVQVVGASADTITDRAKVLEFIKETRINFPVLAGRYDRRHEALWTRTGPSRNCNHWTGRKNHLSKQWRNYSSQPEKTNRHFTRVRCEGSERRDSNSQTCAR